MNYEPGPYETVIPVHPKDANKLPYLLPRLVSFTDTVGVRIIQKPGGDEVELPDIGIPIKVYRDDEILDYDRTRFGHRPNWVMQQFLKVFQDVTDTDWFLVIDSDLFFNAKIDYFDDGHPVLTVASASAIKSYFRFNKAMLGIEGSVYPHSLLSECTLYHKDLVSKMLTDSGYESVYEFLDAAAEVISPSVFPADAEMYGAYVLTHHPGLYKIKRITSWLGGYYGNRPWTEQEINDRLSYLGKQSDVDVFTMHSWETSIT